MMRIVYAVIAVFLYLLFMGWAFKTDSTSLCGNDTFWLAIAILAAGAMVGGD